MIDRPAPFPICVRRLDGSGATFDLALRQADPASAVLSGPGGPAIAVAYEGRLPLSIPLTALPAPGDYLLGITAADGATPEVSDEHLFRWSGERAIYFNLPTWLSGSGTGG